MQSMGNWIKLMDFKTESSMFGLGHLHFDKGLVILTLMNCVHFSESNKIFSIDTVT